MRRTAGAILVAAGVAVGCSDEAGDTLPGAKAKLEIIAGTAEIFGAEVSVRGGIDSGGIAGNLVFAISGDDPTQGLDYASSTQITSVTGRFVIGGSTLP